MWLGWRSHPLLWACSQLSLPLTPPLGPELSWHRRFRREPALHRSVHGSRDAGRLHGCLPCSGFGRGSHDRDHVRRAGRRQPQHLHRQPSHRSRNLVGYTGLGAAAVGGLDFKSDGTLFAAVNIVGDGGTGAETLATINKATGVATVIGAFGTEGMEGIAFDAAGRLWGSTSARGGGASTPALYRIDPATGAATLVAPILSTSGTPPSGGVVSLQFACDGTLYGGTATGLAAGDGGRLITINPATRCLRLCRLRQRHPRGSQPRRVGVPRFPLPPNLQGPMQERWLAELRGLQEPGRLRQLRRDRREEPAGRRLGNDPVSLTPARPWCRPRSTQGAGLGRKESR